MPCFATVYLARYFYAVLCEALICYALLLGDTHCYVLLRVTTLHHVLLLGATPFHLVLRMVTLCYALQRKRIATPCYELASWPATLYNAMIFLFFVNATQRIAVFVNITF